MEGYTDRDADMENGAAISSQLNMYMLIRNKANFNFQLKKEGE